MANFRAVDGQGRKFGSLKLPFAAALRGSVVSSIQDTARAIFAARHCRHLRPPALWCPLVRKGVNQVAVAEFDHRDGNAPMLLHLVAQSHIISAELLHEGGD